MVTVKINNGTALPHHLWLGRISIWQRMQLSNRIQRWKIGMKELTPSGRLTKTLGTLREKCGMKKGSFVCTRKEWKASVTPKTWMDPHGLEKVKPLHSRILLNEQEDRRKVLNVHGGNTTLTALPTDSLIGSGKNSRIKGFLIRTRKIVDLKTSMILTVRGSSMICLISGRPSRMLRKVSFLDSRRRIQPSISRSSKRVKPLSNHRGPTTI